MSYLLAQRSLVSAPLWIIVQLDTTAFWLVAPQI